MATYEFIIRGENISSESPISTDTLQPTNKVVEQVTQNGATQGIKAVGQLISYRTIKSFATQIVNHEVSLVQLRTGSNEMQVRANFINSVSQQSLGILESTIGGLLATGGNPIGALAGAVVGMSHTLVSYAQKQHTIDLESALENQTIRRNYIRAGLNGSRNE